MARNSDEFEITIPPEERWENRVEHGHTRSQWIALCERFNWRCAYCGIRRQDTPEGYLTRDHIEAVYWGGSDNIKNIVPACKACNYAKSWRDPGDVTPDGICIPQPKPRTRVWRWR